VARVRSVRGREEFRRICSEGRRARGELLSVYGRRTEPGSPVRFGLAVGGRGISAVRRNRIRRRLRAALREAKVPAGLEFVVRAGAEAERVSFQLLVEDLEGALERAGQRQRP
jgi:ribonuclease P protein component